MDIRLGFQAKCTTFEKTSVFLTPWCSKKGKVGRGEKEQGFREGRDRVGSQLSRRRGAKNKQ